MKKFLFLVLLLLVAGRSAGQGFSENTGYLSSPIATEYGIVTGDNYGTGIYLIKDRILTKIVSAAGSGRYFTFSSSRNTIYYKAVEINGGQAIYGFDLSAGKSKMIFGYHEMIGQLSIAANGTFVYSAGEEVIILHGTSERRVRTGNFSNLTPVSPDAKYFIYNDNNDNLHLYNLQTNSDEIFTDESIGYFEPVWSPDSRYIVYSSLKGVLYIYDIVSKSTTLIGKGFSPSWHPGGTAVIFEHRLFVNGNYSKSDLAIYSLDTKRITLLTATEIISERTPSFTDENNILFTEQETGKVVEARLTSSGLSTPITIYMLDHPARDKIKPEYRGTFGHRTMDIPYVHQVYDTPDWYNGHWACGPTTAIMLIAYWNLLPPYEGWCSWPSPGHYNLWGRYITDRYRFRQVDYQSTANDPNGTPSMGGFGYMWNGNYSPYSRMASYYGNHGIAATREDSPTFAKAEAQILSGNPYTICNGLTTAGHIVLAHGVNSQNRSVTVNDPYGNKNTPGYPSYDGKNAVYDWPGYNNGYQNLNNVFWCVNTSYNVPAHGDTVIDDLDYSRGFYLHNRLGANMLHWKDMQQGYKGHFWYTSTKGGPGDTCYATWKPNLLVDGMYEVKTYIPFSNATDAVYRIFHVNGQSDVTINQKAFTNQWASLGVFQFKAGSSALVRLGDFSVSTGQEIVYDALQWNYAGPALSVDDAQIPSSFGITAVYPNPFNPAAKITYSLDKDADIELSVVNIAGEKVLVLEKGAKTAGIYHVELNSAGLSSGVYFAVLQTPANRSVEKLILTR